MPSVSATAVFFLPLFATVLSVAVPEGFDEPCTTVDNCEFNLVCVSGKCKTTSGVGDTCRAARDCISPNYVCIGGQCGPLAGIGEECDSANHCRNGIPCVEGVCVEYTTRGNNCTSADDCQGVRCGKSSKCEALKVFGADCQEDLECQAALLCTGGTCSYLGTIGAGCSETDQCAHGLVCDGGKCCDVNGSCEPPPPHGSSCRLHKQCSSTTDTLTCIDRRCAWLSPLGGRCETLHDCWESNPCTDRRCVFYEKRGQPCENFTQDCQDVGCSNGKCIGGSDLGASCFESGDFCIGNLVCLNGTCQRSVASGEVCLETEDCLFGLECMRGTCCEANGTSCESETPDDTPPAGAIAGGVIGGVVVTAVLVVITVLLIRRRRKNSGDSGPDQPVTDSETRTTDYPSEIHLPSTQPQSAAPTGHGPGAPLPPHDTVPISMPIDLAPPQRIASQYSEQRNVPF